MSNHRHGNKRRYGKTVPQLDRERARRRGTHFKAPSSHTKDPLMELRMENALVQRTGLLYLRGSRATYRQHRRTAMEE